jgi:hypothetical protein
VDMPEEAASHSKQSLPSRTILVHMRPTW